jgi:hypothetical protein
LHGDLSNTQTTFQKPWSLKEDMIFSRFDRGNKSKSSSGNPSQIRPANEDINKSLAWENEFNNYLYCDSDIPEDAESILEWWHVRQAFNSYHSNC